MMKRISAIIFAVLTAAAFTGCGGADSSGGQAAPNGAADSASQTAEFLTDGSKCGVLQKAAEQDDFELKGLILTTGSGHHDYPAIEDLIKDGYKTEGLYSEYYLNEWIGVYADCDHTVSLYVVKNDPDTDYAAMTESDLIKVSEASSYPIIETNMMPDADENGHLTNFYVHPEMGDGLYNMCFVSGEKVCYVVQLSLLPEYKE